MWCKNYVVKKAKKKKVLVMVPYPSQDGCQSQYHIWVGWGGGRGGQRLALSLEVGQIQCSYYVSIYSACLAPVETNGYWKKTSGYGAQPGSSLKWRPCAGHAGNRY